ncbi:hypothetical protein H5410_026110 [Solanum commersonii]|uniref:Uncharacterized protein n=1 Tax=Solanum commersonii TaxID=4109 RepID=A0A9J5YW41_SOLCO|nr:hypothetical protein H5410_026110 [Solanum commersonii]
MLSGSRHQGFGYQYTVNSYLPKVENPSSFNFFIPLPDETPSTPVCGVGETSVKAASRVQTETARKRIRESIEPKNPTSTPFPIKSSDTESEDVVAYVTKKRKQSEKERVKLNGSPRVQKQSEEKKMTREERITAMENQKMREFFYKMELLESGGIATNVRNVEICLDEEILGIILGVPMEGIRTIEGCKPSNDFTKLATKGGDVKNVGLPKRFLKGEY